MIGKRVIKWFVLGSLLLLAPRAHAQIGSPVNVVDGPTGRKAYVTTNHALTMHCDNCGGSSGGGLTDAELRASPVPVSGDFSSDGLTNTQLRLTPVVVQVSSGTVAVSSVAGTVLVDGSGHAQPVTGVFYQATQPVSIVALPLPSGAATEATLGTLGTEATLALIKAKTDNLDVALSTRTKPADSQTVTGSVTATQATGSNLHVAVDSAPTTAVTGPLTDAQLRASAVPVSGTVAATESGTWIVQPGNTANTTAWKVDASATTQPVSNAGLSNIDVALSTRLKPADTLAAVTTVGTITNPVAVTSSGLTNLDVALSTRLKPADTLTAVTTVGTITNPVTVTGALTDTQLRASAVPISAAALPLPSGAALDSSVTALTKPADQQHALIDGGIGVVDANNSSTTPLIAGATFTGTATDVLNYASVTTSAFANQDGGAAGYRIQFSKDGTNWDDSTAITIYASGTSVVYPSAIRARYMRVLFVNGAFAQTIFRLQTILLPIVAPSGSVLTHNSSTSVGARMNGSLTGLANASAPTFNETAITFLSEDLSGNLRVKSASGSTTSVTQATGTNLHAVIDSGSTTAVSAVSGNVTVVQPSGNSLHAVLDTAVTVNGTVTANGNLTNNNAAPTTTNIGALAALANAAAPTWTEGNQVVLSTDKRGNLRETKGDSRGQYNGQKNTYTGALTLTATTSTTSPFFTICGNATTVERVQHLRIGGSVATTAVRRDIVLKKTASATSGGTATTLTYAAHDSSFVAVASVSQLKFYTIPGTTGGTSGFVGAHLSNWPITATIASTDQEGLAEWFWNGGQGEAEPIVLRGTAECLEAAFGTAPGTVPTLDVEVTWTEE